LNLDFLTTESQRKEIFTLCASVPLCLCVSVSLWCIFLNIIDEIPKLYQTSRSHAAVYHRG